MGKQKNLEIKYLPIDQLIPYARNARTHSEEQITQIAASIKEFGFNNPVLIDSENGIVAGHGRVNAANKLGLKQIPCIELGHLSEVQKKAFILADNKLALNAGWDEEMLKLEIEELKSLDFNLDLTGFDLSKIEFKDNSDDIPEKNIELDEEKLSETNTECPKCGFKWQK